MSTKILDKSGVERLWAHIVASIGESLGLAKEYTDSKVATDVASHANNTTCHVTSEERDKWNDANAHNGTLSVEKGGTGYTSITDTTYTTARYRASALVNTETAPTVNGVINWVYE